MIQSFASNGHFDLVFQLYRLGLNIGGILRIYIFSLFSKTKICKIADYALFNVSLTMIFFTEMAINSSKIG